MPRIINTRSAVKQEPPKPVETAPGMMTDAEAARVEKEWNESVEKQKVQSAEVERLRVENEPAEITRLRMIWDDEEKKAEKLWNDWQQQRGVVIAAANEYWQVRNRAAIMGQKKVEDLF